MQDLRETAARGRREQRAAAARAAAAPTAVSDPAPIPASVVPAAAAPAPRKSTSKKRAIFILSSAKLFTSSLRACMDSPINEVTLRRSVNVTCEFSAKAAVKSAAHRVKKHAYHVEDAPLGANHQTSTTTLVVPAEGPWIFRKASTAGLATPR
ncbi:hypothetical protein B0H16DRAFT_1832861 [Mycena metata]|uniref:Uncharacterized protein n=1 Tax=Mycena metata TaxID=1033252 RepID=A0AAD7DXB5_9AGAR|nr:hypothetical protein B0H16DRAFT_1832861 [Mycena metata]